MNYIWKKCYKEFFGRIFLGAYTVQTVPKYIYMQHLTRKNKIPSDQNLSNIFNLYKCKSLLLLRKSYFEYIWQSTKDQ